MGFMTNRLGRKAYSTHVKGNRLNEQKRYQEAQKTLREALDLYGQAAAQGCQDPRVMLAYGVLLLKMEQYDKAREVMLKSDHLPGISKDQKAQLRLNYAICNWKLGNLDKAIEMMQDIARNGKTSMIYGSLGYMLIEKARQTGDFAEAIAFNDEAYEYDEDDAVVLDNLGQLNLALGEREKALDYFKRAHERKPSQVDTLYYLAKLACEDGEKEQAKEYLQDALQQNYSALCTTTKDQAQELLNSLS